MTVIYHIFLCISDSTFSWEKSILRREFSVVEILEFFNDKKEATCPWLLHWNFLEHSLAWLFDLFASCSIRFDIVFVAWLFDLTATSNQSPETLDSLVCVCFLCSCIFLKSSKSTPNIFPIFAVVCGHFARLPLAAAAIVRQCCDIKSPSSTREKECKLGMHRPAVSACRILVIMHHPLAVLVPVLRAFHVSKRDFFWLFFPIYIFTHV